VRQGAPAGAWQGTVWDRLERGRECRERGWEGWLLLRWDVDWWPRDGAACAQHAIMDSLQGDTKAIAAT